MIVRLIEEMKANFLAQTGREATDIYLGKNEIISLRHELQPYLSMNVKLDTQTKMLTGLRLHDTDDETHCGLGIAVEEI